MKKSLFGNVDVLYSAPIGQADWSIPLQLVHWKLCNDKSEDQEI